MSTKLYSLLRNRMFVAWIGAWAIVLVLSANGDRQVMAQEELPLPPSVLVQPDGTQEGLEELARGPIHEAFAEQVSYDPIPGIIVAKEPPPPVPELPPEYKPEGDGYVFISGYWFWDVTREDFIWVSGGYRQLPPDTVWIEGYWHQVDGGWQRVSGFYSLADNSSVNYYRTPPQSLENGPIGAAPSPDHLWSPGYWAPYEGEFVWRPGYWQVCRPGWVWVPRFWRWTPRGCVLVGGYWDYPWDVRGHCFAPVYFHRPIYLDHGWFYRPRIVLRNVGVQFHWFVRPLDCHYYFGDWYDVGYYQRGFIPGFQFHVGRRGLGFDPCFAYNQWHFGRQGLDYLAVSVQWNRYFVNHVDLRPPRTFVVQNNVIQNINQVSINNININNTTINNTVLNQTIIADTIQNTARQRGGREGWRQVESAELTQLAQSVERSRHTQRERAQAESAAARLASVRGSGADAATIQQLEQLSREQQSAAREARQRASEQVTRRMANDTNNQTGPRSGWAQNPGQPQRSDRELIHRLDRQLPQVAIGDQAGGNAAGRARSGPNHAADRTVELVPPRGERAGINTRSEDAEGRGRGTGWRSPAEVAGNLPNAANPVAGRGLTPAPGNIDRSELERRSNNRPRTELGNPARQNPPVIQDQTRNPNPGITVNPNRNSGQDAGNANPRNAGNQGRTERTVPPSNPPADGSSGGRGTGWQDNRGGRGNESPPAVNQPPQTRAPANPGNSSSVPRQGGTTTAPRVAAQPNVVPSTPPVPQIDRAELERRAAQRNQVQDAAPRGGWTQPRSDNVRNPSAGTSSPNRAPVQNNPIQIQPQTRPPAAQPARPNRTVEQTVPQVTPRTAPRETPQVRVQPERTTPPARVQPERSAPPVRVQPERSTPPARIQPERAAPPVRVQPERSAPRASGNVAPPRSSPPRAESTQPPRGGWNEQRGGANRNNSRQGGGRNN